MSAYPTVFEVTAPERWERIQVLLRAGILIALGFFGVPLGSLFCALYLILPLVAAVFVSQRGAEAYLTGPGRLVVSVLRCWNAFVAYLSFLTDRFPADARGLGSIRFEVTVGGAPTVGGALLRPITSLPELVVVAVLSCVGAIVWVVAALGVLINERVPTVAWRYLHFVVGLQARLLVYHASMTDLYPPLGETAPSGAP